ncbi:MAG: S8/S53 family peptidase [Bacteroidia bacterium]
MAIALAMPVFTEAQVFKYWVMFNNKTGTPYSVSTPTAYLSPKAIARRTAQGIAINASDLPVTPSYVSQVDAVPTTTVLYRSKWLNGVVVLTDATAITTINSFSFVASTYKTNRYKISPPVEDEAMPAPASGNKMAQTASYNYGSAYWQQKMMDVECLHNMGYRGQGMTIAVIDGGFNMVNTSNLYDSLFMENRLLGTRDFVMGDTMVFEDDVHGARVLSTMAANKPGVMIGTAPKAKYWLLRSEDVSSETISEEYNWVRAAEFADSVGADVCTTSLIYNQFDISSQNHTYSDLTGRIAPMSIAANMAARKGMIMLNCAGNEGANAWYYICVPADADSIITVGSVDSLSVHSSFSSYGPTFDGRIKPDLSARGTNAIVAGPGPTPMYGSGTSYATPMMAGATACLWQYKNFATNIQVITAMKNTATNTSSPNNSIGWGVPQLCSAAAVLGSVGIKDLKNDNGIKVFPNPFSDMLTIDLSGGSAFPVKVRVTDVQGKEVYSRVYSQPQQSVTIKELSELGSGFYILTLTFPDHTISQKISKHD